MIEAFSFRVIVALVAILIARPVDAGETPEARAKLIFGREWFANTTSSMGVTGDIRLTSTSITFDRRVTFKWRYLSEILSRREPHEFLLFELVDPKPQAIANGNHLCGDPRYAKSVPLARYLAVGLDRLEKTDELRLFVFSGVAPPTDADQDEGNCGGYGYFRKTAATR